HEQGGEALGEGGGDAAGAGGAGRGAGPEGDRFEPGQGHGDAGPAEEGAAADSTPVDHWLQLAREAHGGSYVGGHFREVVQPRKGVGPNVFPFDQPSPRRFKNCRLVMTVSINTPKRYPLASNRRRISWTNSSSDGSSVRPRANARNLRHRLSTNSSCRRSLR